MTHMKRSKGSQIPNQVVHKGMPYYKGIAEPDLEKQNRYLVLPLPRASIDRAGTCPNFEIITKKMEWVLVRSLSRKAERARGIG